MDREPASPVVLIYHLGNSEPQVAGSFFPRGGPYREKIVELLGAELDEGVAEGRAISLRLGGQPTAVTFPMLADTLAYVLGQHDAAPVHLHFVVTNQDRTGVNPDRARQDTFEVPELVARWLEHGNLPPQFRGRVRLQPAEEIEVNPADADTIMPYFAATTAPALRDIVASAASHGGGHAFYSARAGTPAMRFAAITELGHEPRLTFVEKPDGTPVGTVQAYLALPRRRTLGLLDLALSKFDFALAHELLNGYGSGFDKENAAVQDALTRLAILRDWHAELLPDAARTAKAADWGMKPDDSPTAWLAARLAREPARKKTSAQWAEFWRTKLLDVTVRAFVAWGREDVPGFIDRLRHIRDISILYGLTRYGIASEFRASTVQLPDTWVKLFRERYGWNPGGKHPKTTPEGPAERSVKRRLEEPESMMVLVWRALHPQPGDIAAPAAEVWLNAVLLLRYLSGEGWGSLQDFRNRHIHNSARFERDLLNDYVRVYLNGVQHAIARSVKGADLVLVLVEQINALAPEKLSVAPMDIIGEALRLPGDLAAAHDLPAPTTASALLANMTTRDMPTQLEFVKALKAARLRAYPRSQIIEESRRLGDPRHDRAIEHLRARIDRTAEQPGGARDREIVIAQGLVKFPSDDLARAQLQRTQLSIIERAVGDQWPALEVSAKMWIEANLGTQPRKAGLNALLRDLRVP